MAEKADSGHGKNGANFKRLKDEVTIMAGYQPSFPELMVSAIIAKNDEAQNALQALYAANGIYEIAINERKSLFKRVNPLCTRITSILQASGATPQQKADGMYYQMKMQGRRAKPKKAPVEGTGPGEEPKYNSVSQLSFDNKIDHLSKFIIMLEGEPLYNPNEPELQVASIKSFLAELQNVHDVASQAESAAGKALYQRQVIFYAPTTGVCDIAKAVKLYIKGVFTQKSVEYKLINKLRFTNLGDN